MTPTEGPVSPERLDAQKWPGDKPPKVSILCPTYNQREFIAQALDGFLMQETTFPVEILVHDDASSDGTAEIVAQFAASHPDLIRTIMQTENQWSKGVRAIEVLLQMARGKYIAICEGDDYWISPEKLQAQVDLLDLQPTASGCVHKADALYQSPAKLVPGFFRPEQLRASYGIDELLVEGNFVPTASIVFTARAIAPFPTWARDAPHLDMCLLCTAATKGSLCYIDRSMSVYRKHAGGVHTRDSFVVQHLKSLRTLFLIGENLQLSARPSFEHRINVTMRAIREDVERLESRVRELEEQHARDTETARSIMSSTTFKIGMKLSKLRDSLLRRAK
jgi:glycosyltransferase involved in cell wall biosynthesis